MKQEKFNSLMVAIVAIAAVFGFTSIVWASFSQTLQITNSSATINASKWDIHFQDLSALDYVGTASGTAPTIGDDATHGPSTVISGFVASLKTPGDTVSFTVDIANHGSYNAKVDSIVLPTIGTLTSAATDPAVGSADCAKIREYISVEFTYENGSPISVGDSLNAATGNVPGVRTVKMTVKLAEDTPASALPSANITVPITPTTIIYGQAA